MQTDITHLRRKCDYYLHDGPEWVRTIWPKPESFNWFLKNHRNELNRQGAIVRLGRDYFVDLMTFPDVAAATLGLHKHREESKDE